MKQKYLSLAFVALFLFTNSLGAQQGAKNIIIMISDGTSWGTWDAASLYEHGVRVMKHPVFSTFPVAFAMTTFPLNPNSSPTNNDRAMVSYDPVQAWNSTPKAEDSRGAGKFPFVGYNYLTKNFTDSAAAATAMATGTKTYNNSINMDNYGKPIPFISQMAKAAGKVVGVITSVSFSHATPGAFGAQNLSRNNYHDIAEQMLNEGTLDLIMGGGGHPWHNESGVELEKPHFDMIAEYQWEGLKANTVVPWGSPEAWLLIQDKAEFEALASGSLKTTRPLVAVARAGWTLQNDRRKVPLGEDLSLPSGIARNALVPTLNTMTKGALQYLVDRDKKGKGFFLMIEGGAVDWSAHSNKLATAIEESLDFTRSLETVIRWVETNSSWNETLLIITTDHGNGMPYGPEGKTTQAFQPLSGLKGQVPAVTWEVGTHSNELVYLWAKGKGSEGFNQYTSPEKKDVKAKEVMQLPDDRYIDNTNVFDLVKSQLTNP